MHEDVTMQQLKEQRFIDLQSVCLQYIKPLHL